MRKQSPQLTQLTLALHIAIALPVTAHAQQLIVNDGSTRTASGTYDTGTTVNASALAALGAGSVITGTGVTATTKGTAAEAAYAYDGGRVELTDSTLKTAGSDAYGVMAEKSGTVKLTNSQVSTTGTPNAHGVVAFAGGQVEMTGGSVATQKGAGLAASGAGSLISVQGTRVTIAEAGAGTQGAAAQDGGVIRLGPGTAIEVDPTSDRDGHGLRAFGAGSQIHASGATVTTGAGTGVTNHNHGAVAPLMAG